MYTFLEMVNLALREVNEVPMTEQQFANARGLQQFAKESTNRAFRDISNTSTKWSWLQKDRDTAVDQEVRKLSIGTQWYDTEPLPEGIRSEPDWNTFLITDKDLTSGDPLVIASKPKLSKNLKYLTYDDWIRKYREDDFKGNTGEPEYVIKFSDDTFGFSPVPDKDYCVLFNVRSSAVRFVNPSDLIPIPEEFSNVLLSRVKYYLWMFRSNEVQADFSLNEYRESLIAMQRNLLSNKEERMRAI